MKSIASALAIGLLVLGTATTAAGPNPSKTTLGQVLKLAQHASDIAEVQNVMGRYTLFVMANHWKDIGDLFALKSPDVRQTTPVKTLVGPQEIKQYFDTRDDSSHPGVMNDHTLTSPVIEIAGDGQTAKAVWDSPGTETPGGGAAAYWTWVRYGVDFIKEDGAWKIWHLKVYPTFRTPYDKSWVDTAKARAAAGGAVPAGSTGATAAAATWIYNGNDTPPLEPAPPKPYETFDPKDAYL